IRWLFCLLIFSIRIMSAWSPKALLAPLPGHFAALASTFAALWPIPGHAKRSTSGKRRAFVDWAERQRAAELFHNAPVPLDHPISDHLCVVSAPGRVLHMSGIVR